MTLYNIVEKLKDIAINKPNINYVGEGDIYDLNTLPNIDYSVFYITQSNHSQNQDTTTFNLTLYYIDRIFQDKSNTLNIQSTGIQVLTTIVNTFEYSNDVIVNYDMDYTTFTHKFSDLCAGVYCNLSISVDNELGICE